MNNIASRLEAQGGAAVLTGLIAGFSFWSTAVVEISAALLVLLFLIQQGSDLFRRTPSIPLLLWCIYVSGVVLSIFFSPFPEESYEYFRYLWHSILFIMALKREFSSRELVLISRIFVGSGAVTAGAAMIRFFIEGSAHATPYFVGLTTSSNLLAIAGLICLHQTLRAVENLQRWWAHAFAYIIIVLGVLFSARVTAVFVLLMGSLLMVLVVRPKVFIQWVAAVAMILFLNPRALFVKLSWIATGNPTDRHVVWDAGLGLLGNLPLFGFGPASFTKILPAETLLSFAYRPPASWHNDVLEVILESGWITGSVYAIGIIGALFSCTWRCIRSKNKLDRNERILGVILLWGLVLFAFVDSVISTAVLGIAWWLLLGGIIRHITKEDLA